MIKILIAIIILIIGIETTNAVTVSISMVNNAGNSFRDSTAMFGNTIAHGEYLLGGESSAGYMTVQIGPSKGIFREDTKAMMGASTHYSHMDISKLVENSGSGISHSNMGVCLNGQSVELGSGLQTDSNVDHAEIHSSFSNNVNMQDIVDAKWHHENVQSMAGLMYNENNLVLTPIKIAVNGAI